MQEALGLIPIQLHTYQMCMVVHSCNTGIGKVGAGRPKVQGNPQSYNEYEASLGYKRPYLKKQINVQRNKSTVY